LDLPHPSASGAQSGEEEGNDEVGRVDCRSLDFDEARSTRSAPVTEHFVTGSDAVTGRDVKVQSDPVPPSEIVLVTESSLDVGGGDPEGKYDAKGITVEGEAAWQNAMVRFSLASSVFRVSAKLVK
jgi:hypothetical protein